ncbi:transcriptional regulator [Croceicoccus estronivorus]|uniref:helix-turn-helix domain-containing protein n=1 Tax=Croceicoccus estronivorus TaxID=1172626 RepID=UPI00082A359A|nr:short-chain fatty acyl-CoA regulator family protein [Croceicoccus estronivorus]OCC24777.1 transcriptional regulator [Croceicoccus estronivorus]
MADAALLAGPALRRLRRREGLTQAAMADRLGISASYLNLVEHNRRPVSARLVVQLVEQFDFDPRVLRQEEAVGGIDGMRRRLADERFADLEIDREEIVEWLASVPQAAVAFARLYDAGVSADSGAGQTSPLTLARREIERWRNHFADLDVAAEELADELRLSNADIGQALTERLRQRHQISVRILPSDVLMGSQRRLDLHARQLQLSEMLSLPSRNFQVAIQLAILEQRGAIRSLVQGARLPDEAARQFFARHLQSYFAAALLMPYGRFLRACEQTGYDLAILQRRFGVSFEQLAHRLTTLQRVGQRGLPFFMARVDRAGQFSKRYAGASGTLLLEGEYSCPLWVAHQAFERAGNICVQLIAMEEAGQGEREWLTIACTGEGRGANDLSAVQFVTVIGVEAKLAAQLAQARGISFGLGGATAVGPGCERCFRSDCIQRSLPPRGAMLQFEERVRGQTPFDFDA